MEPFADTFLLGDVTVAYDRVQPCLARCPPANTVSCGVMVAVAAGRRPSVHSRSGGRGSEAECAGPWPPVSSVAPAADGQPRRDARSPA